MDLKLLECDGSGRFELSQDMVQGQTLVNKVINFWVS
jgi:hypothetical protein